MSSKFKFAVALAGLYAFFLGLIALVAAIVWHDLKEQEQAFIAQLVTEERIALLVFLGLVLLAGLGFLLNSLFRLYVSAPRSLAEQTRLILSANPKHRIEPAGAYEMQELAQVINSFADSYASMRQDVEVKIAEAKAGLEQEKNRLAALMSELTESVVVCNIEGRILLYNNSAKQLLSQPLEGRSDLGAGGLVGLGRSIFALLERNLIAHSLENIQNRLQQGDTNPVSSFVTTTGADQLIRIHMAPVLSTVEGPVLSTVEGPVLSAAEGSTTEGSAAPAAASSRQKQITGFVLTLEDITKTIETGSRRDVLLQSLTEGSRASLANIRAAVETMLEYPDMEQNRQKNFIGIIGEEARNLSARLDQTVHEYADLLKTQWPLEEMLGVHLIAAAQRRIENKLNITTNMETVEQSLWLKVDSYSLTQAITFLASRLKDEFKVGEIRFRLSRAGRLAYLDMIWRFDTSAGAPITVETLQIWESQALSLGGEASPLSLKDVMARHGGEAWYQVDRSSNAPFFRLLVPVAEESERSAQTPAERRTDYDELQYYDFDLFHQAGQTDELDQRLLTELSYTVFDTETTGLRPSEGDEIISIGAVRIVNGRLLQNEMFEQLVDPRRPMSPESVKIHGIEPAMLEGQPAIAEVLPAFHRFCEDTVLVAHNAAFDMRFLQMKEVQTGIKFTHPVLDTLLLSAVIHPNQESHRLEAIAERLGINVFGRHTAVADAIVTGEMFLRMIPLLVEQGIRTLKDARETSEKTYYARIQY